jgi:hypothetical protein
MYLTSLFMIRYFYLQNVPEIFESYREIHNYNTFKKLFTAS